MGAPGRTYSAAVDRHRALAELHDEVVACRTCPRLVEWREQVAVEKRAAYRDEHYWGRPVPGFGDPDARLLIVGLAPGAHGANRTGRVFTGDRSGDFLYAALHRAGYASQPTSVGPDDGLELADAFITAPVKCVPPANKPTGEERAACRPFFVREVAALERVRVVLVLGQIGYVAAAAEFGLSPRPKFGHGVEVPLPDGRTILCSFHVSQQNTFTGRLTEPMFDAVLERARALAEA
ncbi:MAG: uracil-DNA glycosylase [Acidimicrobiaceae bacterium]|nr:uracil-DNA glycosylase [Acidimicrobiaceae bacterium]